MRKLIGLLLLVAGVSALNTTLLGGTLSLGSVNYYPFPAQPGEYIDFYTSVLNGGSSSASGVQCRLEEAFPFSLDSTESAVKNVGFLAPTQGFLLKYKVRVEENAVPGDNEVKLSCKTELTDWVTAKLNVFIQPKEAVLAVSKVSVTPEEVKPGARAVISISLKNSAKVYLRDVSVSLSLNDSSLPFAPFEDTSEKRLGSLKPEEEAIVQYSLVSSPDALLKVYKIPVSINYFDALGKQYSKRDLVGVSVSGRPELLLTTENELLKPQKTAKLSIRVSNAGISDAKFLSVSLGAADAMQVLSNPSAYVGTISSDNYETVSFQALFEKPGKYSVPLQLKYKDSNNNDYAVNSTVTAVVYSDQESFDLGLEKRPDYAAPAIIVLLLAGFLAYRFFKKRRQSK